MDQFDWDTSHYRRLKSTLGKGLGNGLATYLGSELFKQGQTGSLLDQSLRAIPSTKSNDLGRGALNELNYIGKSIFGGRLPYTGGGVSSLPRGYTHDELVLAAKARASQIGTGREGSAGGGSLGGGNMGGYTGRAFTPAPNQQPAPLTGPTPIIMGTRDGVTPDWSQSDQYKSELAQYANTVAGPSKEALGMQIWAQAHPDLAAKVRPGQAGYDVIQKQGIRQPGQPEGVVSMPWSMQQPVLGATNAWNPEQQQPAQVAQPEMGEDRTGSTNEKVQAFLNMLTGVGQGR